MTLGTASVEVHRHVGLGAGLRQRGERGGVHDLEAGVRQLDERRQSRRGGEEAAVEGKCVRERAQGRHGRQQIAEPQRAQRQQHRPRPDRAYGGHEGSIAGHTTSSRSSQSGGISSANTTVSATCSGRFSIASGGGL